jgi:hypothetical protein
VVINEIHYHPPAGGVEFVELHNQSSAAVALFDAALDRGWRLGGIRNAEGTGVYEFPAGTVVPAGGYLLLVPVDPGAFRGFHRLPASLAIAGPYLGGLAGGGERLELLRPAPLEEGEEPYVVADALRYDDEEPWPLAADGGGASLERVRASGYANEPRNWAASLVEGGTPGVPNSTSEPVEPAGGQVPGDITQDGRLNIADAVSLLRHLFAGGAPPCGGDTIAEGGNRTLLDLDASRRVDLTDAVFLLNFLFRRGPLPALGTGCVPIEGCPAVCAP